MLPALDQEHRNTWHKAINDMRPGDNRDEARTLAFKAANMIRHQTDAETLSRAAAPARR